MWAVLAGYGVGLLATTMGRLYNSAFYALWDTRTPLRFAIVRVALVVVLGYLSAIVLPPALGIARKWGVAGLAVSAGVAGWVEFWLLRWKLNQRIGWTGVERSLLAKLWAMALIASAGAFALKLRTPWAGPRLQALLVIPVYGAIYVGAAYLFRVPELRALLPMVRRRLGIRASS